MRRPPHTLTIASLVMALAGCLGGSAEGTATTDGTPPPTRLVAQWESYGGLAATSRKGIRPPRLAVYEDGLVVADAARRLTLPRAEVTTLVGTLRRDLADGPATPSPTAGPRVFDATTTVLSVRSTGGAMRSVTAYALQETRSEHAYPSPLYHALDAMTALADRATRAGTPYTAHRVRLIAQVRPGQEGRPWPASVPEPPATATGPIVTEDLSGAQADAAVRLIRPTSGQGGAWPLHRDRHARTYALSWRYLLPSE
ncbi:hypothetical protein Sme01_38850 [Sphaerisporangium melleum]|uniref:Lipoprotein n=1 Tax=Sphaerisporangium melleum TaxID=321316 RepID=A0A917R357_9ACTN|nr:hypothetical protein [Sphaerisporangium melleum]GGK85663.1 hypothetical protein GCM10007964_30260 [Sphaerisporangium melleum]GII71409.1 hypothetical protein Sme01_38850 [Sphaerisporangium melleum]